MKDGNKKIKMEERKDEELKLKGRWSVGAVVAAFITCRSRCYDTLSVENTVIFYV